MSGWLSDPLVQPGFDLGRANLPKFLIRNLRDARIRELRYEAVQHAFLQILFGDDPAERVTVTINYPYDSRPEVSALAAITTAVMECTRFVNISTAALATLTARKSLNARVDSNFLQFCKPYVSHSNWLRCQAVTPCAEVDFPTSKGLTNKLVSRVARSRLEAAS